MSDLAFDTGVLDIALWPSLERQAAGLPAFRSYDLRGSQQWPAVAAWLEAMDHRPSVRAVASDDGTLVRLLSRRVAALYGYTTDHTALLPYGTSTYIALLTVPPASRQGAPLLPRLRHGWRRASGRRACAVRRRRRHGGRRKARAQPRRRGCGHRAARRAERSPEAQGHARPGGGFSGARRLTSER